MTIARLSHCKRCDSLPGSEAVSRWATTVGDDATHGLELWLLLIFSLSLTSTAEAKPRLDAQRIKPWFGGGG